jgi:hypothetical protein
LTGQAGQTVCRGVEDVGRGGGSGRGGLVQHRRRDGGNDGGIKRSIQLRPLADSLGIVQRHSQQVDTRHHHDREHDGDVGLAIPQEVEDVRRQTGKLKLRHGRQNPWNRSKA